MPTRIPDTQPVFAVIRTAAVSLVLRDRKGQDMIEYALMAAAFTLVIYGLLPTEYLPSFISIWQRVNHVLHVIGHA
ncbi:MAG: hypothetical protein IT159_09715 [Bryobacterales bacterium]|nr:hypothetical protein [Bryobacterales bacterium]